MADNTSVRVAVRVRPLVESEKSKGCRDVLDVIEENEQIVIKTLDKDKAYTFNYVLSTFSTQQALYNRCVQPLLGNLFKGYNLTILAYGQTGSGKTHTMGTAYMGEGDMGVIPRAITEIFDFIKDNFSFDFIVTVSFMELYQEILYDLLSDKPREQCTLEIREDVTKGIHIPNLTEIEVNSVKAIFDALQKGTSRRATSSTAMNAHSSRSHAILTVNIAMNSKENGNENKQAKLHLVDLAGSERPKKTGAVGNTFKEGVTINKGLFVLGNVISALGDEKGQHGFIPYRDSNLTRLLKDSLGGNSITLMIACVSPADYNLEETISTLRYADRAKKIKNKPIVNQDPKAAEINSLKKTIQQLRLQIVGQGGPVICPAEIEALKRENVELKCKKRDLSSQLTAALFDNTNLHEKIIILQNANELLNGKLLELKDQYEATLNNYSTGLETNNMQLLKENFEKLQSIKKQFTEISNDQMKTEDEIATHDHNKHSIKDSSENEKEESEDMEEKQESHTNRQLDLKGQLSEIEKQLNLKESLAKQYINSNQYVVDYQAMAENESKINQLEKEKEELLQVLKNIGNSGKISEQRRKRVQELEQQIVELKKKVQEQNHLIKQKARAEERIKSLNQEIIQMKQTKVKLVKAMRDEAEKFRQWRLQKERECIRLKQQDIKKEHEIVRMKVMHTKQQNVFKRRVEEAEAINKRLKLALSLKQQSQESRNIGKAEKIEPWLKQEFDLCVNFIEAETTLNVLLEDRATLQLQLDQLKNNGDVADSSEIKSIEEDLELRSAQIQDMQQKLLDTDQDVKAKARIEKFQTMAEAKYGIKFLFAKTAEVVKEKVCTNMKLTEVQELYNEAVEKLKICEKNHVHRDDGSGDWAVKEHEWLKQLQKLKEENKQLSEKLQYVGEISTTAPPTPVLKEKDPLEGTFIINRKDIVKPVVIVDQLESSLEEDIDSVENDPDWRKTPLGKRVIEEKRKLNRTAINFKDNQPVKRQSDGSCTCKTICKSRCGCRKMGKNCTSTCKCNEDVCENREKDTLSSFKESDDEFKKPSVNENEILPNKRQKKTKNLFSIDI
ncbi:chromosome-associated kinesin KIF4 isoform X1 [Diorhabda sublineata]|uniref:chromosome-associated kinesin KIF4 isoform X1 n=1 Tax=Diorhabda sublineata TaxID=1163346 RepID=UPI0024E0664F|nr:chromosome-associated kinesin KIF4 isoform X1 [Diorhabda sublineata]XP_056635116.1 chromosome-associated kinesin KIF4 isoform X1 [Diorhabda sublineata]